MTDKEILQKYFDTPVQYPEGHFNEALSLLRDLADLQNGPPLVRHEKEWNETMEKVYAFLNTHENISGVAP